MSKETSAPEYKKVSLNAVVEDLRNGLTKWKKDDIGFGSIEKKYNLLVNESLELFNHPKIKNLEHRIPTFVIIDDLPNENEENTEVPESHKSWIKETELRSKDLQTRIVVEQPKVQVQKKVETFI